MPEQHDHVFLGAGHDENERRTWWVISLCAVMMVAEIVGGILFGSIALVADGLHMSTHAGALLLAALAYTFARKHARNPRFTFGTGKLGDLAGFTSAIVLLMIALLIGYEAVSRLLSPVEIHFSQAIPIACVGLAVNVASAWLLSGSHSHGHQHGEAGHDESHRIALDGGTLLLEVFEKGVPPRFRLRSEGGQALTVDGTTITTVRPKGDKHVFALADRGSFLESVEEIPEPHEFAAQLRVKGTDHVVSFVEHEHGGHDHDNNMRAALVHVMADAAVSIFVITGLVCARFFGWVFMDSLAGIAGAVVIASWSRVLIRDTGAILLDMHPDQQLDERIRRTVEADGDRVIDLHLWRLGPGHLGAVIAVATSAAHGPEFYKSRLRGFSSLSHVTIEVQSVANAE